MGQTKKTLEERTGWENKENEDQMEKHEEKEEEEEEEEEKQWDVSKIKKK